MRERKDADPHGGVYVGGEETERSAAGTQTCSLCRSDSHTACPHSHTLPADGFTSSVRRRVLHRTETLEKEENQQNRTENLHNSAENQQNPNENLHYRAENQQNPNENLHYRIENQQNRTENLQNPNENLQYRSEDLQNEVENFQKEDLRTEDKGCGRSPISDFGSNYYKGEGNTNGSTGMNGSYPLPCSDTVTANCILVHNPVRRVNSNSTNTVNDSNNSYTNSSVNSPHSIQHINSNGPLQDVPDVML